MTIEWARLGMCRSLTVIVGRVPHQASCGIYGLVLLRLSFEVALLLCATSSGQFSFRWFGRSRFSPAEQGPDKRRGFYERHHALRRPGQGHTGLYNTMCQPKGPGARFGQATGGDGLAMRLTIIKCKEIERMQLHTFQNTNDATSDDQSSKVRAFAGREF